MKPEKVSAESSHSRSPTARSCQPTALVSPEQAGIGQVILQSRRSGVGCIEPAIRLVHRRSASVGQGGAMGIGTCRWRGCTKVLGPAGCTLQSRRSSVGCIKPAIRRVHRRSARIGQGGTRGIGTCRWRRCTTERQRNHFGICLSAPHPNPGLTKTGVLELKGQKH